MAQVQHEIITVDDGNSAEIGEPAGAAVVEAFNARERSEEADFGSQPPNHRSDAQEVQAGESKMTKLETSIRTLAKVKELEPTEINLWKVAVEFCKENITTIENRIHKREEEMRSIKNEIYQVVGFFSAFQGLLMTAAAQSILLRCNNVGFILTLSAFATAAAVFGIWQKTKAMDELRFTNFTRKIRFEELCIWLQNLEESRSKFHFGSFDLTDSRNYPRKSWKEILVNIGTWLVVSVIAFGGLCMVAMHQIVCNPGHSLPSN